jgi:ACDE family multidrug resistance protein
MSSVAPESDERLRASPLLLTIFAVTLMAVLGVASIAPALPNVAAHFEASAGQVAMLVTVFTLPGVALAPLMGLLADRWGRRVVLVPALLLFALAGTACATAGSLETLLLLRLIQGVGAAPMGAINVTLIGDAFRGRRQIAAMGANSAVLSVGTAAYPLLGGLLADADWRLPFALPVLALPIVVAAWRTVPSHDHGEAPTLRTYFGRLRESLSPRLVALMGASLLTFIVLYGSFLTYMPFLMHERFNCSSSLIGLVISSASLASGAVSLRLAPLTHRFGQRRLILVAVILYVVSMGLAPRLPSVAWLTFPALLFGAANGLNIPTIHSWIAREVERDVRAGVMSLNAMMLRGGQSLGPVAASLGYAIAGLEGAFGAGVLASLALMALVLRWCR